MIYMAASREETRGSCTGIGRRTLVFWSWCGLRFEWPELEVERLWGGESGIEKHALSVADFVASQV